MRLPWSPRRGHGAATTSPSAGVSPPRLSSPEVTALRVRALRGDPLHDVRDATREWVFRSLLIGKHLDEWAEQAGLAEPHEIERALQRVRRWYQHRLANYHATQH